MMGKDDVLISSTSESEGEFEAPTRAFRTTGARRQLVDSEPEREESDVHPSSGPDDREWAPPAKRAKKLVKRRGEARGVERGEASTSAAGGRPAAAKKSTAAAAAPSSSASTSG